ncbi:MAG: hypothetical protein Q8O37_07895 [Sulfuricellaceae bacterium]|nr:hypothetical protein [Sulfuricellaceae bacterium]
MIANDPHSRPGNSQRGVALILLLMLVSVGALAVFVTGLNRASQQLERDRITNQALAQAKDALIGYAVTYRDKHPDEVFGYLPCPDADGNGVAESPCGGTDVSVIGRLPWKTLGLPPIRDGDGECLWYAVSGHAKNNPKTDELNWDTVGQFEIRNAANTVLVNAGVHNTPWAVIMAPRSVISSQDRFAGGGGSECGGNNTVAAYLDGADPIYAGTTPAANANTVLTFSTAESILSNTNNDRGLWIAAREIFDPIKKRSDFLKQIRSLLNDPYFGMVGISGVTKGTDSISCTDLNLSIENQGFCKNWKEMLLLSQLPSPSSITIDGMASATCTRVLLFGGQQIASQIRLTLADKGKSLNYLEDPNLAVFKAPIADGSTFSGIYDFDKATPSSDVIRCINGGAVQKSFAGNFDTFSATGTLVSNIDGIKTYDTGVTTNTTDKTLTMSGVTGTAGACFWYPDAIPLAGKTLRAFYDYRFSTPDTYATTGAARDRGNGFTFQMVRSDFGYFPDECGSEADMGALTLGGSGWNSDSLLIETDVRKNSTKDDPAENHTAIMYGGNLTHSLTNGNPTTACNGTAAGCRHNPANKFEESPGTLSHNQRIEIHTGCNSTCSTCNPASHVAPNTYARISTWVDCIDCDDVATNVRDAELITYQQNRDFSAPGNWGGTSWMLGSSVFSHVAGAYAATLPNTALRSPPFAGTTFEVAMKIATSSPGKLVISIGGVSATAIDLVAGSIDHVARITATSTGALTLKPDATWEGSIDNVSVKRLPTIQRCVALDPKLNSMYFGFTGGFRSSVNDSQGVTFRNFYLRSE